MHHIGVGPQLSLRFGPCPAERSLRSMTVAVFSMLCAKQRTSENSVMAKFAEFTIGELQALWSCTLGSPPSVSKARKPSAGVLSTSGIRNDETIQGVYAPAAQEVHHVRPLLRSSGINEITLATCLHEHTLALAHIDEAYR